MKTIFKTGISGNLGNYLKIEFKNKYKLYGSVNQKKNLTKGKNHLIIKHYFSLKKIITILKNISPDYIIHCAAITNIEKCEINEKKCYLINSFFSKKLAKAAKLLGSKFIYISTDQLYNGNKSIYNEKDKLDPLNNYAKSKALAEKLITQSNPLSLILRLSFIGSSFDNSNNFIDFVINNLKSKTKIQGFDDVNFTPVSLNYLSKIILKFIKLKNANGIYNVSSKKIISKYVLCRTIAARYNLNQNLILKSKVTQNVLLKAIRPKNMSLDAKKMEKKLNLKSKSIKNMVW